MSVASVVVPSYAGAARLPRLLAALAEVPADARRAAVEDLYWGLLTSREFLFQH